MFCLNYEWIDIIFLQRTNISYYHQIKGNHFLCQEFLTIGTKLCINYLFIHSTKGRITIS